MTLSDFERLIKYSTTRSVARSLYDSWASCLYTPLHSTPPLGDSRRSKPITVQFSLEKLVALPGGRRILRICSTTEYRRVTDGQTDRQTLCDGTVRAMHMRRAVKTSRDIPCDHAYCCTHVSVAVCQSARWSASKMCWERSVTNGSHFRTPPLSI